MNCPSCLAGNLAGACHCFACGATLDPALDSLRDGALFASRYEITGPLGRGGMGMVYRAHDRELGEVVAIKVLRPDLAAESGRIQERFRSEIRLARRVRHKNVCSVYGDGEDRGLLYICMELVEGENLKRRTREGGGLPEAEAWDIALQVLSGLEAIHEVGIVHRDLKTANLMRDQRGVVRVMDFGIAKHNGEDDAEATVTATGTLIGTPEYMSPEQLRGGAVDFRSDLYSLAIVIHELFTGELPFRGTSAVTTIVRQLQEPPSLSPALPESLRPVLARALGKRPNERFATAAEMRHAVEEARRAPAGAVVASRSRLSPDATDDATRPVDRDAFPERVPFARLVAAQLMLIALSAHLIAAGGVVPPPCPVAAARPAAPKPPARRPIVRASRHVARPAAPPVVSVAVTSIRPQPQSLSSTSATPTPAPAPAVPGPTPALDASRGRVDTTRVYDEDEVDVKPRRIEGMTAPYPDWGPRLSRGKRASIVANFVVTENGDVTDIRVEEGGGVLEAVLPEMSRWKWEPGRKNGVPVKVRMRWRQTYVGGP
jgi:hypothetical protein